MKYDIQWQWYSNQEMTEIVNDINDIVLVEKLVKYYDYH